MGDLILTAFGEAGVVGRADMMEQRLLGLEGRWFGKI
jgi:hypothetical protein